MVNPHTCIYIYLGMNEQPIPVLPCLCANFRRATRAITQLYNKSLRPLGLQATQFTVLQALSLVGEVSQGKLGRILATDSTTLTRTLEIMRRKGHLTTRYGQDRRERWLGLSDAGKTQLKRALPHWEKAQARLRRKLAKDGWENLLKLTYRVTNLATE